MKKSLSALMLLSVISLNAVADCESSYQSTIDRLELNYRDDKVRMKKIMSASATIALSTSLAVGTGVGTFILASGVYAGTPIFLSTALSSSIGAAKAYDGYKTIKEAIHPEEALANLNASLQLLNEASAGDGTYLRSLTDKINAACTSTFNAPLTVAQVGSIIQQFNSSNAYCPSTDELATYWQIQNTVVDSLNRGCRVK